MILVAVAVLSHVVLPSTIEMLALLVQTKRGPEGAGIVEIIILVMHRIQIKIITY